MALTSSPRANLAPSSTTTTSTSTTTTVPNGTVQGTVTDAPTGMPIAGATVAWAPSGSTSTTTDAAGHYTLTHVNAGTETIMADAPAHTFMQKRTDVPAGGTVTVDFAMNPA